MALPAEQEKERLRLKARARARAQSERPEADMSGVREMIQNNLNAAESGQGTTAESAQATPGPEDDPDKGRTGPAPSGLPAPVDSPLSQDPTLAATQTYLYTQSQQEQADSFLEALESGLQISVSGLLARREVPDMALAEDASMFYKIAHRTGILAGDVPAMIAGAYFGGPLGAAGGGAVAGPPGAVGGAAVGAGAGAFAIPEAMRTELMYMYERGQVSGWKDFWERLSGVFIAGGKGAVVGGTTLGAGRFVGKLAAPLGTAGKTTAQITAEVGTMVTVGSALEGEVPEPEDVAIAAIMVGGLRGTVGGATKLRQGRLDKIDQRTASKLRRIYAKTGVRPSEIVQQSMRDPVLRAHLLSNRTDLPKVFTERTAPKMYDTKLDPLKPTVLDPKSPLAKPDNVLARTEPSRIEVEPLPKSAEVPSAPFKAATDAEAAILNRVGELRDYSGGSNWNNFMANSVDDLHAVKVMRDFITEGKTLPAAQDPYVLARLTRGSYGKAGHMLEYGVFDYNTLQNTGKPLQTIIEPFIKEGTADSFKAYAIAARAVELDGRGIQSGIPLAEAQKVLKQKDSEKFEKAFEELQDYQNGVLKYLKDSGVLSKKSFKVIQEANKSYVPMYRVYDEAFTAGGTGKGLTVRNPVKAIKGSENKIADPIESIAKNTYMMVTLAERNRAMQALETLNNTKGAAFEFMSPVKTKTRPIEVSRPEVKKFLEEHGIEATPEMFTIFRPMQKQLAPNEILVFRNGKPKVYETIPEIANAIRAMDRDAVGLVTKIAAVPAQALRAGVTLSPDFMARNLSRDTQTAFNLANGLFTPINTLQGLWATAARTKDFQDFLKAGGANSALISIDRNYISQTIFKLNEGTGFMSTAHNVVKSPLETLRITSELIENASRVGEYQRVMKKVGKGGDFEAGFAAREITLDFQRIGAKTRAMNMITAFFNAHVQGLDKARRAFNDRPAQTSFKVAASITAPSVLLWWANKDDPRWKEIPQWQKDLFWIVMTEDTVYRIPKPFELGIMFGSVPERILEAYYAENPDAFEDLDETLFKAFVPSYTPNFALPVVEHWANKSYFTDRPLVPYSLEKVLPEYQYSEYTTETAKLLGKFVANTFDRKNTFASPVILENYIRAWSGTLGVYALDVADNTLKAAGVTDPPPKASPTLADIPAVKAFVVRYPAANAESIVNFYENYEEVSTIRATIKKLAKEGDFEAVEKELAMAASQGNLVLLDDIRRSLSNMNTFVRMLQQNPDMTPEEKRQLIDNQYLAMIEVARHGNEITEEIKKLVK